MGISLTHLHVYVSLPVSASTDAYMGKIWLLVSANNSHISASLQASAERCSNWVSKISLTQSSFQPETIVQGRTFYGSERELSVLYAPTTWPLSWKEIQGFWPVPHCPPILLPFLLGLRGQGNSLCFGIVLASFQFLSCSISGQKWPFPWPLAGSYDLFVTGEEGLCPPHHLWYSSAEVKLAVLTKFSVAIFSKCVKGYPSSDHLLC